MQDQLLIHARVSKLYFKKLKIYLKIQCIFYFSAMLLKKIKKNKSYITYRIFRYINKIYSEIKILNQFYIKNNNYHKKNDTIKNLS